MKILLLGGTGAMGAHLCRFLAENPANQISVTTRKSRSASGQGNIDFLVGNAKDNLFLQDVLGRKWDAIVDFMSYSTKEFKERLPMLLEHTAQYVFLSSSRVYANSDALLTEDSPRLLDTVQDSDYLKTDEYALTKARQEDLLRGQSRNNWTIIRPYITFSEQRLQLGPLEKEFWLYRALSGRSIVFSKDMMHKRTTMTYGLDVARGIASIIGHDDALGEVFHITQPKTYAWGEILDMYLDVLEERLGRRPNVVLTERSVKLQEPGRYQVLYDRLFDRMFDDSKIGRYIDVSKFSDPAIQLKECLKAFLADSSFRKISFYEEAKYDRIASEHIPIRNIGTVRNKAIYFLFRYFPHIGNVVHKLLIKD